MTNENSKHSKKEQPQESDEDFLWKGSTEEYLDSLIDQRLEILEKSLLETLSFFYELYSEKRFITYLIQMRQDLRPKHKDGKEGYKIQ